MIEPEETRKEPYLVETWHAEPARIDLAVTPELRVQEVRVQDVRAQESRDLKTRAMGSPLPAGTPRSGQEQAYRAAPPQGRALSTTSSTSSEDHGMQRARGVLRQAMPC